MVRFIPIFAAACVMLFWHSMLLNEFLKEHSKMEEQEKTIAELKSGITVLAATVKEQAALLLHRPMRITGWGNALQQIWTQETLESAKALIL